MRAVMFRIHLVPWTLVRFLRLIVWPQQVAELTNGKKKKITGENLGFVKF